MSQLELALFDTPPRHAQSCCPGDCLTHVLMPNMAYACGKTILTVAGHFEMGTSNYDRVTCPGCLAHDIDTIRRRMRWQMGKCEECAGTITKGTCVECGVAE